MENKKDTIQTVKHRKFEGEVVSAKEKQTIHVLVSTKKLHPKYNKLYAVSRKYAVHDPDGKAKEGDSVSFEECRPISKTKRWRLTEVLSK